MTIESKQEQLLQELLTRLEQVEEDLSVRGSMDNNILVKMDAINARLTESERVMTTWVETEGRRQDLRRVVKEIETRLLLAEQSGQSNAATYLTHTEIHIQEERQLQEVGETIVELRGLTQSLQKDLVVVDDVLAHTEHSEDRRHVKAIPTAKGYRIEASVELYGSDNHIVGQELAKLVEECRRELREPLEEVSKMAIPNAEETF